MKKLIFILILFCSYNLNAQDTPKVCISQEAANKCSSIAGELIEARQLITEFTKERELSFVEREKAAKVIEGLNELVIVKDRIISSYEQVNALYKKVLDFQFQIIEKLEQKIAKGKSAFQKFVGILKDIGYILAGIALGRGI